MITPTPDFWKVFKETPGALSCAEALAIMNVAVEAPNGLYLELGTHKGKSAISAIRTLKGGRFTLVDPIFEDIELERTVFELCYNCNTEMKLSLLAVYSTDYLSTEYPTGKTPYYSYVFVDSGSHGDGLPMQEVKLLENRMVQGGIIAFHDYKNQFVEVEQAYDYLVSTGKYEPIHINWQEIFDYVSKHNLEDGNNSWHQYPDLPHPPNFLGALRRR